MDAGTSSTAATLAVRVTAEGVEQAKAAIASIGPAGEAAAAKTESAFRSAFSNSQAAAQRTSRDVQALEVQLNTLSQITAGWANASAQARDIAQQLAASIRDSGRMAGATASQIQQLAEAEAVMARQTAQVTDATRAMTLMQMRAIEMDEARAASSSAAGVATGMHGLQTGRLTQELGTFIGRVGGANTAVTRLGAMIGGNVIGMGEMAIGLVAIAGLLWVWDKMTEGSKKAADELKRLTKAGEDFRASQGRPAGEIGADAALQAEAMARIAKERAPLIVQRDSLLAGGSAPGSTNLETANALNNKIIALNKSYNEHAANVGAAKGKIDQLTASSRSAVTAAELENDRQVALNENYTKSALALRLLNIEYDRRAAHNRNAEQYDGTTRVQMDAATDVDADRKTAAARLGAGRQATESMTALTATNAAMVQGAVDADRLAKAHAAVASAQLLTADAAELETTRLNHLEVAIEAATKKTAADVQWRKELVGATKEEVGWANQRHDATLKAIDDEQRQKDATVDSTAAVERQNRITAEQIALNKEYAASKDAAFAATLKATDAANAEGQAAKKSAVGLVDQFFQAASGGATKFWDSFRLSAERAFAALASKKLVEKLFDSGALASLIGSVPRAASGPNDISDSSYSPEMLAKLHPAGMVQTAAAGLGIAAVGFGVGSFVGSQTTNRALGTLGGAAGGAATGFAMGGPIGAFVGAAAGAVGGFLGAGNAAEAARKQLLAMTMAAAQTHATLADWRASVTGLASDQREAAAADLRWKWLSIRQTIEQVEAGKKMEEQRNKDLAEADAIYAMAQKNLTNSTNQLNNAFTGLVNGVNGYRYQGLYLGTSPFGPTPGSGSGSGSSGSSGGSGGGSGSGGDDGHRGGSDMTIKLVLPDGSVLATTVVRNLQVKAQEQFGDTTRWGEVHLN